MSRQSHNDVIQITALLCCDFLFTYALEISSLTYFRNLADRTESLNQCRQYAISVPTVEHSLAAERYVGCQFITQSS